MRSINQNIAKQFLGQLSVRALLAAVAATVAATPLSAQRLTRHPSHPGHDEDGPVLHVNPRWKECSFQLSPTLTQAAWRQFTAEAAVVTYFRPLVDAAPMGRGSFEVALLQWQTQIDDADAAWNDTMVHPDSAHYLFEGSGLKFPGITARVGVANRTDVGVFFTKNPNANYSVAGMQVQQNLLNDVDQSGWAAATRVSAVTLYGPADLNFAAFGVDLLASRKFQTSNRRVAITPYATVSGSMAGAREKSPVVTLKDESVFGTQASAGAVVELYGARVAMEYVAARVSNVSMKVGFALLR